MKTVVRSRLCRSFRLYSISFSESHEFYPAAAVELGVQGRDLYIQPVLVDYPVAHQSLPALPYLLKGQ